MKIISNIRGRVRIQSNVFKIKNKAQSFKNLIEDLQMVTNISFNTISGTMIINYKELDNMDFKKRLNIEFLKFKKNHCKEELLKSRKAIYHIVMTASLGFTIGSIIIKNKKIHAISGIVFTLMSLEHMRLNRKSLFKKQKFISIK